MDRLPDITATQRADILAADRTPHAHAQLMQMLPAMTSLDVGGRGTKTRIAAKFTVAAWNVERCLFPEKSADLLRPFAPDVILLSEMDNGMARTGQRHTTAAMADALQMHYAYGVEFYEMGLGGPTEQAFCKDDFNEAGWHGNAILSAAPFQDLKLVRLDRKGHWFVTGDNSDASAEQPRIGGRMAIAAVIETEQCPVCFVSTHLESNANAAYRHAEFALLLAEIADFAPDMPCVIGGDLNTGNHMPPEFDWRDETLFALAKEHGFEWSLSPDGVTTRKSLITPHPTRQMKLDWFCHRGLSGSQGERIDALDADGVPLSDHDCVIATAQIAT